METEAKKVRRPRGTGSIFQRPGSENWWIQYSDGGKICRESAESPLKNVAEKKLRKRLAAIETGQFRGLAKEKITVAEMMETLLQKKENGELRHTKSLDWDKTRWEHHLKPFFGHLNAKRVSEERLSEYIAHRREQEAAPATINRELALLRRAFKVAKAVAPDFTLLEENNVRTGFLTDEQYAKLADETGKVGLWLRALLEVAVNFGLRKGELLDLRVGQVDRSTGRVRLEGTQTKNGTPRGFTLTPDAQFLVFALLDGKKSEDHVFTREDGKPVINFRRSWEKACTAAGVPNLMVHDLRRTAVRNMVRSGVPQNVAQDISGHKTPDVFRRYNITSEADWDAAAEAIANRPRIVTPSYDTVMTQSASPQGVRPN